MRRSRLAPVILVLLLACSTTENAGSLDRARSGSSESGGSPARASRRPDAATPPSPHQKIPERSGLLAKEIARLYKELRGDIDRWVARGARLEGRPARLVSLKSLYLQRIYRKLGRREGLAQGVLRRLRGSVAETVRANIEAARLLFTLVTASRRIPRYIFRRPLPPQKLRRLYDQAQGRFEVPWHVLAAVNYVESKFGRILGPSSAGALGPMQFLPSTWAEYGAGGDILDPRDSIMGAARYLRASGAPSDLRGALFAYNPSEAYVDAILIYADEIRRDVRNFYVYYFWQVFYLTPGGSVQLTGPGARGPGAKTIW